MAEKQILPLLPYTSTILFPQTVASLHIGLARNIQLMEGIPPGGELVLAPSLAPQSLDVAPETILLTGVLAKLTEVIRPSVGYLQASVEGIRRIKIEHFEETVPYLRAEISFLEDQRGFPEEEKALVQEVLDRTETLLNLDSRYPKALEKILSLNQDQPGTLG